MTRTHYPKGKSPWYPLYRSMGGPQSRSGRSRKRKLLAPIGNRNQARSQVTISTELMETDFGWHSLSTECAIKDSRGNSSSPYKRVFLAWQNINSRSPLCMGVHLPVSRNKVANRAVLIATLSISTYRPIQKHEFSVQTVKWPKHMRCISFSPSKYCCIPGMFRS
jgi:hypothetical protein